MAEENQIQQVTTKDPKKVEAGKKMAEHNHIRREELKALKAERQYFGIGGILTVGVIGVLSYCLYQAKKGEVPPQQPRPQSNKLEME